MGVFLTSGKLDEKIAEFAYAYTFAYLYCKDETIRLDKEEYEALVGRLSEIQTQKDTWSWLQGKFAQIKAENLQQKITDCENAVKLREEIEETLTEIRDIVTNFDEIKRLAGELKEKLSGYYDLVTSNTNEGRYEAGRLVVPALSLVIPATKAAAGGKTKNLLKGAKELTESETDDLVERLVAKGEDAGIINRINIAGKYSLKTIQQQTGFVDLLPDLLKKEGLTMDDFHYMMQKNVNALTDAEKVKLTNIRTALPKPDAKSCNKKHNE